MSYESNKRIRVVVADDHEVVRTGLTSLFRGSELEVVGKAGNGDEAVEQVAQHRPDVVLLDIRMPVCDGLSSMEKIRQQFPDTCIVIFSGYDNPTYIARSVALGAADYVLKGASREELLDAITRAARGDEPPESSLLRQIKRVMRRRHDHDDDGVPLTNREMQVLRHVALGLSNREIGKSLEISIETVKEHVQNILRKLEVNDRTQAAVWAVRRGVV
jgi:DNA-binding NarL/FixJ family response regulator